MYIHDWLSRLCNCIYIIINNIHISHLRFDIHFEAWLIQSYVKFQFERCKALFIKGDFIMEEYLLVHYETWLYYNKMGLSTRRIKDFYLSLDRILGLHRASYAAIYIILLIYAIICFVLPLLVVLFIIGIITQISLFNIYNWVDDYLSLFFYKLSVSVTYSYFKFNEWLISDLLISM